MFYYYILNGLELAIFLLPVYIENKEITFCYMGMLYYILHLCTLKTPIIHALV